VSVTEELADVVRIERTFEAPVEDVFDAWTSPEVMRRWYHAAPDWETPVAEVDLRVGGTWRVLMRAPDGSEHELSGEYTEVERPHRLAMTCNFNDDPSNSEQLVELTFSESQGSTTVVLVNSRIPNEERWTSQDRGWGSCLVNLERVLTA
jgi:uncharacterized protein YndB with AHSA1/START domain